MKLQCRMVKLLRRIADMKDQMRTWIQENIEFWQIQDHTAHYVNSFVTATDTVFCFFVFCLQCILFVCSIPVFFVCSAFLFFAFCKQVWGSWRLPISVSLICRFGNLCYQALVVPRNEYSNYSKTTRSRLRINKHSRSVRWWNSLCE